LITIPQAGVSDATGKFRGFSRSPKGHIPLKKIKLTTFGLQDLALPIGCCYFNYLIHFMIFILKREGSWKKPTNDKDKHYDSVKKSSEKEITSQKHVKSLVKMYQN
jgi:hypothetical protein